MNPLTYRSGDTLLCYACGNQFHFSRHHIPLPSDVLRPDLTLITPAVLLSTSFSGSVLLSLTTGRAMCCFIVDSGLGEGQSPVIAGPVVPGIRLSGFVIKWLDLISWHLNKVDQNIRWIHVNLNNL